METDDWDGLDWDRLAELREVFLGVGGPRGPYWRRRADLELYDLTFGARIASKWRAVLAELARRGFPRTQGTIVDWGAGTGVAARAWLGSAAAAPGTRLWLVEQSGLALAFARERTRAEFPVVAVADGAPPPDAPDLVLLSHVINELAPADLDDLVGHLRRAQSIVWVEPGARETSRMLGEVRERLLSTFEVVAPCTHRERCGALASERDWCHFFAAPEPAVFTERGWALFAKRLSIDLRSLPYSYLAMARSGAAPAVPAGAARAIGRARIGKGRLLATSCEAPGLRELALLRRTDPELFEELSDTRRSGGLYRWRFEPGEPERKIAGAERL